MNPTARASASLVVLVVLLAAAVAMPWSTASAQSAPATTAPPPSVPATTTAPPDPSAPPAPTIPTVPTTAPTGSTSTATPPATTAGPGGPATTATTLPADTIPPTLGLQVAHPQFSPNGDHVREKVWLALHADETVTVELVIHNHSGTARKVEHYVFGPGDLRVSWGGRIRRNGRWGRAPDGAYQVKVTAADAAGNTTVKTHSVRVDTKAPTFAWQSVTPDPWGATGALSYNATINDASGPLRVQGAAWERLGLLDLSSVIAQPPGSVRLAWRPNYSDGSVFLPGNYYAAMRITDDAGNAMSTPFRTFRVDRSVTSTVVRRVEGAGNQVAVTFDDCNEGAAWSSILATLERFGVGGTFFCPGDQVYAHPDQARATVAAGMTIGSHSNGHAQLPQLSYGQIVDRLQIDKQAWWSVAGATPMPYFRPPYGSYNSTVLDAAGATGFRYTVIWDVDPTDYTSPGADVIASRVLTHVRPGSVVLLHVKAQTAQALPAILSGLRSRGLTAVSLAQLLRAGGVR